MNQNISPILKNFNAYDILQPEKLSFGVKENVSTDILVDISDSDNSELQHSVELSPELHGSFLDKVKKSEFDLVDVFQNIYVTPAQITKNCEGKDKNAPAEKIEPVKIDFTELFDKAEQGEKLTDWKDHDKNGIKKCNLDQSYTRTYEELFDRAISSRPSNLIIKPAPKLHFTEPESIGKDETDSVLRPKRVLEAPIIIKNTTPRSSIKTSYVSHNIDASQKPSFNSNFKMQNLLKNTEETIIKLDDFNKLEISTRNSYNHDDKKQMSDTSQDSVDYNYKNGVSAKINQKYCHEIKASLADLNSPPVYRSNSQKESIPILQTVKMDPKAYIKRRIVKTDSEKIGFTKGPDIYEKSVVLPQIMKRLSDRKQILDKNQRVQRKLILETRSVKQMSIDEAIATKKCVKTSISQLEIPRVLDNRKLSVGSKEEPIKPAPNQMPFHRHDVPLKSESGKVTLDPEVLMEDCSLKRVAALNTRIAFEKFVLGKPP